MGQESIRHPRGPSGTFASKSRQARSAGGGGAGRPRRRGGLGTQIFGKSHQVVCRIGQFQDARHDQFHVRLVQYRIFQVRLRRQNGKLLNDKVVHIDASHRESCCPIKGEAVHVSQDKHGSNCTRVLVFDHGRAISHPTPGDIPREKCPFIRGSGYIAEGLNPSELDQPPQEGEHVVC